MKCGIKFSFLQSPSFVFGFALVLVFVLSILPGKTLLWSQSNGQLLNSKESISTSSEHLLREWAKLYSQGDSLLQRQETDLQKALREIQTLKTGSKKLTVLLEQSSSTNQDLKNNNAKLMEFNNQIASRMQERDEDLAYAYDTIDKQEKTVLRLIIAVVVMGALILGTAVFHVGRFLIKLKMI